MRLRREIPASHPRPSIVRDVTEIPEHLLKRSQARRAGGEAPAASASPATTEPSVPAIATPKTEIAPAGPPPVKPDTPTVAAYRARKKIPVWAMVTLSILPLWLFLYVLALQPVKVTASGPLGAGAKVYGAGCAGCHGAGGAGVAGGAYGFTGQDAITTFPHIEDQLRWVSLGTNGYRDAGVTIAGDPNREGGPHISGSNGIMPTQKGQHTEAEILGAVCFERYELGGAPQDTPEFELWCSTESAVYTALESGSATFDNLDTVLAGKGIMKIGSVAIPGTGK